MAITYSYIITGFNSRTGAIYMDVTAADGQFTTTRSAALWAPFRGYGVLPIGPALNEDLMNYCSQAISASEFERIKALEYYGADPSVVDAIQALINVGSTITIALASVTWFTPTNGLEIVDTVPIAVGMHFDAMGTTYTVTNVSGTTVSFTPAGTFTPNFVPGTLLTFTL